MPSLSACARLSGSWRAEIWLWPSQSRSPLQFLTATAIAFLGAGASVAWLAFQTQGKTPNTMARALLRVGPAVALAPVLVLLACGVTRSTGLFPIGSEGWELIFEPLSSALLAVVVAAALVLVDGVFFRRIAATTS